MELPLNETASDTPEARVLVLERRLALVQRDAIDWESRWLTKASECAQLRTELAALKPTEEAPPVEGDG